MPLEPYQSYQPSTPEPTPSPRLGGYGHNRNFSNASSWSTPDSAATHLTTPSASPPKSNSYNILPKIRTQDQVFESDAYSAPYAHRRAQSQDPDAQTVYYRAGYQRSTTSPPDFASAPAPLSETSAFSPWDDSAAASPLPTDFINAYESLGHGRSVSTSSIDSCFRPVGNPYYRTMPKYVTQDATQCVPTLSSDGMNGYMSFSNPGLEDPFYQELPSALTFKSGNDPVDTIQNYLTSPNPPIHYSSEAARSYTDGGRAKHYWWDVRNIRPWDDFNFEAISSLPDLHGLLGAPISLAALPSPARLSSFASHPQDVCTLANTIQNFHIAKVNAALKVSTPRKHINMSLVKNTQDGSYFVSNLADEIDGTLGSRGKVVGLVKPFDCWNSGKKSEQGQKQVDYLSHLAHLQLLMRQHNCRYGFIVTEIELVCVRLGTKPEVPDFGFLELSRPIAMSTNRDNMGSKNNEMSVCLALWYLNVLARSGPDFGQPSSRINVGPPEALSRSKVHKKGDKGRDDWMPVKVMMKETRQAKSVRGWAWPEDPLHRQKEGVGSRAKRR